MSLRQLASQDSAHNLYLILQPLLASDAVTLSSGLSLNGPGVFLGSIGLGTSDLDLGFDSFCINQSLCLCKYCSKRMFTQLCVGGSHIHYFIPGSKLTFSTNLFKP